MAANVIEASELKHAVRPLCHKLKAVMVEGRLSASEEANLIAYAQKSGFQAERAYEALERAYRPMLDAYVNRIGCDLETRNDAEQMVRIAFYKAIMRFSLRRNVRLASFARHYLNGSVQRFRRKYYGVTAESLDAISEECEASESFGAVSDKGTAADDVLHDIYVQTHVVPAVQKFLRSRPVAQRRLAERMLMHCESQAQAAVSLCISRQAVSKNYQHLTAAGRVELAEFE